MSTILRRSCGRTFAGAVSNLPCKANRRAWTRGRECIMHVIGVVYKFSVRIRTYVRARVYMEGQCVQRYYSRYVIQSNAARMHAT